MADGSEADKPRIEPIYSQNAPDEPIELRQAAVCLGHQGKEYKGTASAVMRFLPGDSLEFEVALDEDGSCPAAKLSCAPGSNIRLTLTDTGVGFDAFYAPRGGRRTENIFSPRRSPVTVTPPTAAISAATFHLFNFPPFVCPEYRVVLKADGWIVTIEATDRTDELEQKLKAQGGYVITHMGRIVREGGTAFCSEQLDDLLACLRYCLSFTLGCWAGVALPVGFDGNGNRVFERWGMHTVGRGSWNALSSWFDPQHAELFLQVFPGFVSLWRDAVWHQPLCSAVYWYLEANSAFGVDTAMILAQTALELLAWTYCVQDHKIVSQDAFKPRGGLSASDKVRMLISSLGIPKEIPPELPVLCGRPGKKWDDGVHAITDIRNSLVHPDSKVPVSVERDEEAHRLSLWYITMALLRLCGHDGVYANILTPGRWAGVVERVPWGKG